MLYITLIQANTICIMSSLINIAIEIGLNYILISKNYLIFIISEFLVGGVF